MKISKRKQASILAMTMFAIIGFGFATNLSIAKDPDPLLLMHQEPIATPQNYTSSIWFWLEVTDEGYPASGVNYNLTKYGVLYTSANYENQGHEPASWEVYTDWTNYTGPCAFNIMKAGTYEIIAYAEDNAGNYAYAHGYFILLKDAVAPGITIHISGSPPTG